MEEYKKWLARFAIAYGAVAKDYEDLRSRRKLDAAIFKQHLSELSRCKENLLREKEAVGLTDGLSFLEDNNFAGFKVKDGLILGDTAHLHAIARPWMEEATDGDHYRFEVANLLVGYDFAKNGNKKKKTGAIGAKPDESRRKLGLLERIHDLFVF